MSLDVTDRGAQVGDPFQVRRDRDVAPKRGGTAHRRHTSLGYEIPPPRRSDPGMPSLWDEPLAPEA